MTGGRDAIVIALPMKERKTWFCDAMSFEFGQRLKFGFARRADCSFLPSRIFFGTAASISSSRFLKPSCASISRGFGGVRADVTADKLVGMRQAEFSVKAIGEIKVRAGKSELDLSYKRMRVASRMERRLKSAVSRIAKPRFDSNATPAVIRR